MKIHVELKRVTAHYMNHYRYEHTLPGMAIRVLNIHTTLSYNDNLQISEPILCIFLLPVMQRSSNQSNEKLPEGHSFLEVCAA